MDERSARRSEAASAAARAARLRRPPPGSRTGPRSRRRGGAGRPRPRPSGSLHRAERPRRGGGIGQQGRRVIEFAPTIARHQRRRSARPGDVWHLDEVRVKARGEPLALTDDRPGRARSWWDLAAPARREGRKAAAGSASEVGGPPAEAHRHRHAGPPRGSEARVGTSQRASVSQGAQQRMQNQPPAIRLARAGDAKPPAHGRQAPTARRIVGMVWENLTSEWIFTPVAVTDAVSVVMPPAAR